jgi:hypothetical protein
MFGDRYLQHNHLLHVSGGLGQQALMEDDEVLSFITNQAESGRPNAISF